MGTNPKKAVTLWGQTETLNPCFINDRGRLREGFLSVSYTLALYSIIYVQKKTTYFLWYVKGLFPCKEKDLGQKVSVKIWYCAMIFQLKYPPIIWKCIIKSHKKSHQNYYDNQIKCLKCVKFLTHFWHFVIFYFLGVRSSPHILWPHLPCLKFCVNFAG